MLKKIQINSKYQNEPVYTLTYCNLWQYMTLSFSVTSCVKTGCDHGNVNNNRWLVVTLPNKHDKHDESVRVKGFRGENGYLKTLKTVRRH